MKKILLTFLLGSFATPLWAGEVEIPRRLIPDFGARAAQITIERASLRTIDIDTSAELLAILTDETGTGVAVFGTAPIFTTSISIGSAGVKLSDDGDGALTFLGLGNGFDENLILNLDDTENTGVFTSTTALATINFSSIALQESGVGVVNLDEIDASSELLAIVDDETGTGLLVFNDAPTFVAPVLGAAVATTLDTGQGANELYDMDQDVLTTSSPVFANVTFATGGAARTGTTATNTLLFQAYDNDTGPGYVTFATLTAGNTPTFDLATGTTIGSAAIYRAGGTDVAFADGGTGISSAADDTTLISSGSAWAATAIADCDDSGGNHLNYDTGTNAFSCGTTSSTSGGTFSMFFAHSNEPPAASFATQDTRNSVLVLDFDADADESAVFPGLVHRDYGGGNLTVDIWFLATTATTGDVVWNAAFERMNTDIDADSFAAAQTATCTTNGTSGIATSCEIAFTNAQADAIAVGEPFRLKITRDADNVADSMTGDAELLRVEMR